MFKIFTVYFLLYSSSLFIGVVSYADEYIPKKEKCLQNVNGSGDGIENIFIKGNKQNYKEFTSETLNELEQSMKQGVDDNVFPILFSKYIAECTASKRRRRAENFFLELSENNPISPQALTAKGIVTYGWSADDVLKLGLEKIDEAILLDKKAFFPRLCRATYLSCMPNSFATAVNEFNDLIAAEEDNPSSLFKVYSNFARMYGEHGHYDMAEQIAGKLSRLQNRFNKNINFSNIKEKSFDSGGYYNEIIRLPHPFMNNHIPKKSKSAKDRDLDGHLAILEKSMEWRLDNTTFVDIYKRYTLLVWQYGEINRAVSFFENLAKKYPRSPNALAASGTITYGWKGQMLLQKGLNCIESAIDLDNNNFFSRLNHATFIAYFPKGFVNSMDELSLLRQPENGFLKQLNVIDSRINLICSQHGHNRKISEFVSPVNNYKL